MTYQTVYQFITSQEENFKTAKIEVAGGWFWNFFDHVLTTVLYKNSKFIKNPNSSRPFKNIIRPILNLQYRAEGFDVKDIELYVNEAKNYFKSFLIRKYHEKWARENSLDTFIDNMVESFVDFGGVLVKRMKNGVPDVVPLQRIAFCDQTDLLSGVIAEKHYFSPSELLETAEKSGWNMDKARLLVELYELKTSEFEKKENYSNTQSATPSPYIEIYEVHGNLPAKWLYDNYEGKEYIPQVYICGFYKSDATQTEGKDKEEKTGITLFSEEEKKPRYKLLLRDEIYGRALGLGGAEELFESQQWTNFAEIAKKNLLDAASKVLYQTADERFHTRNKTQNLENGEIMVTEAGKPISQINTFPNSAALFERLVNDWEEHAKFIASAEPPALGQEPKSGTPFRLQALVVNQGLSIHEYRKGKIATFLDEIYKDWILPSLVSEILKGKEFLAKLDVEEMQDISQRISDNETNRMVLEKVLSGVLLSPEEIEAYRTLVKTEFQKGGNKKFIKILKDEFKNAPIDIKVNIAGKQSYLAQFVEKLGNIFQIIAANPAVLNDPRLTRILNQMLEASNMEPISLAEQPIVPQLEAPTPAAIPA